MLDYEKLRIEFVKVLSNINGKQIKEWIEKDMRDYDGY